MNLTEATLLFFAAGFLICVVATWFVYLRSFEALLRWIRTDEYGIEVIKW